MCAVTLPRRHVRPQPRYPSTADIQHTVAHESGHGMLLAHNPMDSTALMWPIHNTVSVGPNSNDIGASASCANAAFGVRCIYGD